MFALFKMSIMSVVGIIKQIKDYIFPVFCLGCGKEGEWLCGICYNKIDLNGVFACPVCHRESQAGVCCSGCRENSFLFSGVAISKYSEENLIGQAIQSLKYSWAEDILSLFEHIIADFTAGNKQLFLEVDYVVPIPLHKKRFAERGFNQAELLARILSIKIGKPIKCPLQRVKHTGQQAKLSRLERLVNVKEAFVSREKLAGNAILVDDVFTTGSTMQECAKALLSAGAGKVFGFTIARG